MPHNSCELVLVDAATGEVTLRMKDHAHRVSWSPSGKHIICAHKQNAAVVLEAATGREVARLENIRQIQSIALASQDGMAAVGNRWGDMFLWNWKTQDSRRLRGGSDDFFVSDVSFSPDGAYLAVGLQSRVIEVWNVESGQLRKRYLGQPGEVQAVSFDPKNGLLASAAYDMTVCLWDVMARGKSGCYETPIEDVIFGTRWDKSNAPLFSPDSRLLAVPLRSGQLDVRDVGTMERLHLLPEAHYPYLFVQREGQLLSRDPKFTEIHRWSLKSGKLLEKTPVPLVLHNPRTLRVSRDRGSVTIGFADGRVVVCATSDLSVRNTVRIDASPNAVALSPDGKRLAVASLNRTEIWDLAGGRRLTELIGHHGTVTHVEFLPGGQQLISSSWDGSMRVWNGNTGEQVNQLDGHLTGVHWVALSPDGGTAVSLSDDRNVRFWNTRTFREMLLIEDRSIWFPVFSPDGSHLVTLDQKTLTLDMWVARRDGVR